MTIIVGALWPWWGEAGMPTEPVRGLKPQVAILASDSRWTISREGKADTYEDVGQKMFQIAGDAGAVYAGDVEAGEEALNELSSMLPKESTQGHRHPFLVARDVFKAVYGRHTTTEPLGILVGHCNPKGFAGLTYFGSEDGFDPQPVEGGVKVIAWRDSKEAFTDGLVEAIKAIVWGENPGGRRLDPGNAMAAVGAAMYRFVLEPGQDINVGGPLQLGMALPDGFKTYGFVTNRAPTDESGWRLLTPEPGTLRTWTEPKAGRTPTRRTVHRAPSL